MRKNIFSLVLLWGVVCLACCKKPEPRPRYDLDQQTKDYTVFLENSTWTYQLEGTVVKDIQKITKALLGGVGDVRLSYDYNTSEIQIFSVITDKIYCLSEAYHRNEGYCNHNMWIDGARTSTKCTFFSNRPVGSTYNYWFYPDNIVTYQEFLPTYMLEGKTYSDVMVFESRYTGASVPFDDVRLPVRVWYAKHIGIIRKEMSNGDFWNLISYDVKQ